MAIQRVLDPLVKDIVIILGYYPFRPACYNSIINKVHWKSIMEFSIIEYKHCDLLKISGRVDSYTSPKIDDALKALLADGHSNIVVDMEKVAYLSSSGMLVFVNAQKQCIRQNRGEIVFSNVPELVLSNFRLAGFDQLFTFYDNVVSAVGRF